MLYKVGIVDDNVKIAEQLKTRLELTEQVSITFYASSGKDAIAWYEMQNNLPDIVLMDIEMPEMDGIETTFRIKQMHPDTKVIMLTVFDNEENIFNAIRAGASGYLLKDEKITRVIQAFDEVLNGGAPMSGMVAQKTLAMMLSGYKPSSSKEKDVDFLTNREVEILKLLAEGKKNQQVADVLFISAATVKKHIENIYAKLQLHSRVELVNWYNTK